MIIIYHYDSEVISVERNGVQIYFVQKNISKSLFEIAVSYPDELMIWCHIDFKYNLNISEFEKIFHHKRIVASYNPFKNSFLSDRIGYVEESVFININKNVTYPTWQMSSCAGGIHASALLALKINFSNFNNFDYFLHSLAKLAMPKGLLCYSEPKLLDEVSNDIKIQKNSNFILFRFVKQHYKMRWSFLLLFNLFLYERKILFLPFVFSLFYSRRKLQAGLLNDIKVESTKKVVELGTIDVIIPTIGRKKYLYDVLKDLSMQTHLPPNIIIVEQNPNPDSVSELDYIKNETWNFEITHIFTHQAGACNARNLALAEVKSEWVFMADDDIRIDKDFLKNVFSKIKEFGINAINLACYDEEYHFDKKHQMQMQWGAFGSGCSIVKRQLLKSTKYDERFEFGFGEDSDFGMQLRNLGNDILYLPDPEIIHLKAPVGGFRTKLILAWQTDLIQPKPSPTVMLYKILHLNEKQIFGYKTILFLKFYKRQSIKNPIRYFYKLQQQWDRSIFWANQLRNQE
ncbi:glycosyltransferase family 2 protein [Flavobacterium hibisci]|uniref:glycosyltransferase family 2 protein n=1 Tax=Flavobacterium hibisci TaxID=1914462 RepID=UPI001CC1AC0D|nr:glycosyltransferase family A protein [Flavobacterium hibisci]MBZ4041938.1 glycosyltransferase family 2 protein [Flavobacterium hibisci]